MVDKSRRVIVIFGPTASGKTGLAVQLAEKVGGEIVNADSRQIYEGMAIISACPSTEEYEKIQHHLFEFLNPRERFSAGRWAQMAEEKIEEILARGRVPILVGGTGFYLRALMEGMSEIPEVPMSVEAQFAEKPTSALYADLLGFDPVLAQKLKAGDRQRILRGLTVHAHTGKRLSEWQAGSGKGADFDFVKIGLKVDRKVVHERIVQRWKKMVTDGVVDEVRELKRRGFTHADPALGGLAIPDFFAHIEGEMELSEVVERAVIRDRQYAKRQYTWLNNTYKADVMLEVADVGMLMAEMEKKKPSR